MPYPTKYTRQYGFQAYQDANPSRPLPGDKVDFDLNTVATSIDEIVEFLKLHSRSDGALLNGVVTLDSLGDDVLSAIALGDVEAVASEITVTPAGGITSTDVQSALEELDSEKLAVSSYTAADVLAKLLTVDGVGSGLDADTLDGFTSAYFQPADIDLSALAALDATAGILARTGADAFAVRTITAPAAGITISNGTGASGNPTLALANDLSALEALASTGLAARTGTDTWAQRSVAVTAANGGLAITNGNGVSGNPTLNLHAMLENLAGLTTAADRGVYWTALNTSALFTLTSAGRALLDDADAAAQRATLSVREVLTANRTYYVRTDGSDSNNGLSNTSGGAFLTIQKAVDVALTLDFSIYNVTIQVADGAYTAGAVIGPYVGAGTLTIQGNTGAPGNVTVTKASGNVFHVKNTSKAIIQGFTLSTTTSGWCLYADTFSTLSFNFMVFGSAGSGHIAAVDYGFIGCLGNYTISGGAGFHWYAENGSIVRVTSFTITLSGTPAFTVFAQAQGSSNMIVFLNTFSGSATGQRYSCVRNAVIHTAGGGATYLPGSTSGAAAQGGQYV